MFAVDVNEQSHSIQVKTNDEKAPKIIADADYRYDKPDSTVLVKCNYVNIEPDDIQQLDQFLTAVFTNVGQFFESFVCLRLPTMFDGQIDMEKLKNKYRISDFMSTTDVKYYNEKDSRNKEDQYELITDKNLIMPYAEPLVKMMKRDAFWSTDWSVTEMQNRINSATYTAMILDKINDCPCGFGRVLLSKTNNNGIFGYISDITVDISHQSKGLGRMIVNYLIGTYMKQENDQHSVPSTLCLRCAHKGSGAVSAPKLYRKSGLEYVNETDNHIAIFTDTTYYKKIVE